MIFVVSANWDFQKICLGLPKSDFQLVFLCGGPGHV